MSKSNGVLARARTRMQTQVNFSPDEAAEFLVAGRDPEFDPVRNVVDGKIDRFNAGQHGVRWRETTQPLVEQWTTEERKGIAAAEAVVAERRTHYERALDERIEAERAYYYPDARTTPEQLVELSRRHRASVERQRREESTYGDAIARAVGLKMAAQRRRQFEAMPSSSVDPDTPAFNSAGNRIR